MNVHWSQPRPTGRHPGQYEGESSMGAAILLVREIGDSLYRFGQARVIAYGFALTYPSDSAKRAFWNSVRDDIDELQADDAAPEDQKVGYGVDDTLPWTAARATKGAPDPVLMDRLHRSGQ